MKATKKKPQRPIGDVREVLHSAFITVPVKPKCDDDMDGRAILVQLARQFGIHVRDAQCWAATDEWFVEREAAYAKAWAAAYHPGKPLDLEGWAAAQADNEYRHLPRPLALARARAGWFRALAPIAHWESLQVVVAERRASRSAA